MTSFDSLQFGISLAFKCKAWPGNSFRLPPSSCCHCRSVATLLRIASPNPCQEAACGDGARTKLNKQLRNIYTDTRNAMNSSGIKIESKDKKYTSPGWGKGWRHRGRGYALLSGIWQSRLADFHTLRHISRARVAVAETITAERTLSK